MAATKTRKISDLFRKGEDLEINDGEYSLKVWLQKLNPIDNETAVRRANAARARFMLNRKNEESEDYLSMLNEIVDYTHEGLVSFLASSDVAQRLDVLEAEFVADKDKGWSKDDYLQGLQDAWDDELQERYHAQTEEAPDEEAQRCYDELKRFNDEFQLRIIGETEAAELSYQNRSDQELRDLVMERMFKLQADLVWLTEYRKCELWLGTRVSKTDRTRVFEGREAVDEIATEAIEILVNGFTGMTVPVIEGKDSQATDTSSQQSKQPETPETEPSSGPVDATV